jgi:hypothetical protein
VSEIYAGDTWGFLEDARKVLRSTTLILFYGIDFMSGLAWLGDCVACGTFRLSVFAYALLIALHCLEVCLMKCKI